MNATALLHEIDVSADWVGVRLVRETTTNHHLRDGHPQAHGRDTTWGAMVEVSVQGNLSYCATTQVTPAGIRQAAAQAHDQAKSVLLRTHTVPERPPATGQYLSPVAQPWREVSTKELTEILVKICHTLKINDEIVCTKASLAATELETWFVSTNGADLYQQQHYFSNHFAATAQVGTEVQTRSDHGMLARCYQGGLEWLLTDDLWERVQRIGEQALELVRAENCPEMRTHLVLAPDQMLLQIHESVGHPLELDRILGDERNYAGWSFVSVSDFGHLQYGSPLMNITFDPTVPGEFASYAVDDTGLPASREYLIQDGILRRGLGGYESQIRTGVAGVACGRACSWNRPPIDRMANLNLEPGMGNFNEVISDIEQGIYMKSNRSWSIDDYRRKFQFGCEYARLIENGQLTKTFKNPNYRGLSSDFWRNLVRLGGLETWEMYGSPYCGKGEPNQAIRVGHGSPVAVFANVEVFGGG
ncbi:peptidase U62, modulator of DNA gyrase [Gloeomargarita lithophora Alchichica-D10]|uniref:Peptidase U62, modulator of DNA gyrase n=2 Tax=Gloeomargarita TaxID=1188227 RepID=A0A1J0AG72_9CYAN|nr:peptidase U62, modulator of DNA gyrase [Gloeomargarita lithophora Alchichica-D10]